MQSNAETRHPGLCAIASINYGSIPAERRDTDKKTRHNTSCDTVMKIYSESFACVCECVFDGIVKLRTAETVL